MPEVILTLNASKYNKDLSASMELTEAKAKEAAGAVEKAASDAGSAGSAAAKKIAKEGEKSGMTLKEAFSKWRETFTSGKAFEQFSGPLAAVELVKKGIESCIELAKYLWDTWTTSAEEAVQINEAQLQNIERQKSAMEKIHAETDSYLARLQELSTAEKLSNAEKQEAARIIDILNSKYKGLNLTLRDVTDSTAEFDEAQEKILKAKAAERADMLKQEYRYLKKSIQGNANLAFENMGNVFEQGRMSLSGEKEFTLQNLTNSDRHMSNKNHLRFLEDLLGKATQETEISALQKLIENVHRKSEIEKEFIHLRKTGYSSEADQIAAETARNQRNRNTHTAIDTERKQIQSVIAAGEEQERINAMSPEQRKSYYESELKKLDSSLAANASDRKSAQAELDLASDVGRSGDVIDSKKKILDLERSHLELLNQRKQIQSALASLTKEETRDVAKKDTAKAAQQALLDRAKALQRKVSPDKQESAYLDSLEKFEKQKGSSASDQEKNLIRRLAELSSLPANPLTGDLSIQTNSLTARGGFQSGAVVPDRDAIQKRIEQNTLNEYRQTEEIKNLVRSISSLLGV